MKKSIFLMHFIAFGQGIFAQSTENTLFFGHSLVEYTSRERGLSYWMNEIGLAESTNMNQQYIWGGPLETHIIPANPNDDHTYPAYNISWNTDASVFTNVVLAEGNLKMTDPNNHLSNSITNALNISDHVLGINANLDVYLYEIWPHCQQHLGLWTDDDLWMNNPANWVAYKAYAQPGGEHLDYFISMQDSIIAQRPLNAPIRLIPVSSVMHKMLTDIPALSSVTAGDLYEDCGPHGWESAYFIAGLIHYMAINERPAPLSYSPPATFIIQEFRDNYAAIVNFIWSELSAFNDSSGNSRVFHSLITASNDESFKNEKVQTVVKQGEDLQLNLTTHSDVILSNTHGVTVLRKNEFEGGSLNTSTLIPGVYVLRISNEKKSRSYKVLVGLN